MTYENFKCYPERIILSHEFIFVRIQSKGDLYTIPVIKSMGL